MKMQKDSQKRGNHLTLILSQRFKIRKLHDTMVDPIVLSGKCIE